MSIFVTINCVLNSHVNRACVRACVGVCGCVCLRSALYTLDDGVVMNCSESFELGLESNVHIRWWS